MKKKITLLVSLCILLIGEVLLSIFWEPIIDWLPIDQSRWEILENGSPCYLDEDGDPVAGWLDLDPDVYYFDPDSHAMQTGWLELEEGRYYLGGDGIRRTGWQTIGGARYYFGDHGAMCTGWQTVDGARYYLGDDGVMLTGWQTVGGESYYLDDDGAMHTGWLDQDEGRMYLDNSGNPHTGWLKLEDGTYYLNEACFMHTGWLELEEGRYYLGDDGVMQTGWLELKDGRYYLNEDGTAYTGWLEIDDNSYYFDKTGMLLVDLEQPAPFEPGFVNIDGWLYYVQEDGYFLTDGDVGQLHFDSNGRYTSGDAELDGYVTELIRGFQEENPDKDQFGLLRVAYDHCVTGGYEYLRRNIYKKGHTGWEIEDAKVMFESGRGNCYNFAAIFWSLARGLGYEAYAIAGNCTKTVQPHGWVQIEIDGADYFFDPEWHYDYIHDGREVKDMFMISMKAASWWYYDWIPIEKGV